MKYIVVVGAVILAASLFGFTKSQRAEGPDYIIVSGDSATGLSTKVKSRLREGYKPAGGVAFVNGFFYQAVVKE